MRALGIVLLLTLVLPATGAADALRQGDAAWERRAEGAVEGRARPDTIFEAVTHYERAVEARPGDLEARWKLLRALHFAGEFADAEAPVGFFGRGRDAAERALDALARRTDGARLDTLDEETLREAVGASGASSRDVARLHFWAAIHWGAWSRGQGLLRTVQEGVANRMYEYARVAAALEPGYDDGAPLRLLGTLHAELPRVPFVSGWVDRAQALPTIERALALGPEHPGNSLLLALTLLDLAPERGDEARGLLERVVRSEPRPTARVEDAAIRERARDALGALSAA